MGNVCRKNDWSDKESLQAWVPLLVDMFTFDEHDNIKAVSRELINVQAVTSQLQSLSILLRKKAGVSKRTIENIKRLHHYQRDHGNSVGGNPPEIPVPE
jgi:hypothetical protein